MKRSILILFVLSFVLLAGPPPARACYNAGYTFALPFQTTYAVPVATYALPTATVCSCPQQAVVAAPAPAVAAPLATPAYAAALPAFSVATYGSFANYNACLGFANLYGAGFVRERFFNRGVFVGFNRFGTFNRGFAAVNVAAPGVNIAVAGGGRRTRTVVRQRRGRTVTRVRTR